MIIFVLYASAGLLTLLYITRQALAQKSEDRVVVLKVVAPYFELLKKIWGAFTTYLLVVTMCIAIPVGFAVIWPLALLLELMISGRKAEMKKEGLTTIAFQLRATATKS